MEKPKDLVKELLDMQIAALAYTELSNWLLEKDSMTLLSIEGILLKMKESESKARSRLEPIKKFIEGE